MFIVCESVALGLEHVPFNAALLKTICLAFPQEKVVFYAEDNHSQLVREQIGEETVFNIDWKTLVLPKRHSSFTKRIASDFKNVKFLLNRLDSDPKKNVLVITGIASILWALKYYTRKAHKGKKIQVIIHRDFTTLRRTPRRSILNPFYYIGCLKTGMRLPGYERLQHIVLEESIKKGIVSIMPFLKENICVLDHPIPTGEYAKEEDHRNGRLDFPIRFGYLGRASEKKGFSKFLEVASKVSEQFPGKVEFHFVGGMSKKEMQKKIYKMTVLTDIPKVEILDRPTYIRRLKRLHFVCLFYSNFYELCASGVLMDSIVWKKPIIATSLSIFEHLQEKFGDIGYICKDDQFIEVIKKIVINRDSKRYQRQILALRKVEASRSAEKLSDKYKLLIEQME